MFSLVSSFECFAKFLSFFFKVLSRSFQVFHEGLKYFTKYLFVGDTKSYKFITTSFTRRSKPTQQNMGILYTFYIFGINIFVSQSASRFCKCKMKIEHPHLYSKALFSWFKYYLNKIDQCAPALRCSIVLGQGLLLYSVVIVLIWSSVSQ